MRKSVKKTSRRHRKSRTMKGGVGAADHAIATYGGIGSQHAIGADNNTIAMNQVGGGGAGDHAIATYGGIGNQHSIGGDDNTIAMRQTGGNMVTNLAVPALFLVASSQVKKSKKTAKRRFRKSRSYRRK